MQTHDLTILPLSKKSWTSCNIRVWIAYLQLRFDEVQNDYLTQTLLFLAGVERNSCLRRFKQLIFFKRVYTTFLGLIKYINLRVKPGIFLLIHFKTIIQVFWNFERKSICSSVGSISYNQKRRFAEEEIFWTLTLNIK